MAKKLKTVIRPVSRDKGVAKLVRMPEKRDVVLPGGAPVPVAPPPPKQLTAEEYYEQNTVHAALIAQGTLPRAVAPMCLAAACSGNRLSFMAAAWIGAVSLFMILAATDQLGGTPPAVLGALGLFLLVGFVVAYFGVRRGKKAVRLVREGILTWALITNVVEVESTSTDSQGNRSRSIEYEVSFMYMVEGKGLHFGEVTVPSASKITDDKQELLIYDPAAPDKVEFADLLPGGLRIDTMGNTSASTFYNVMGLLPFLIVIVIPVVGYFVLAGRL